MYAVTVLSAAQQHQEGRINLARERFGYEGQDLILVEKDEYISQIETLQSASNITGESYQDIASAAAGLQAYYNIPVEDEAMEALRVLGVDTNG